MILYNKKLLADRGFITDMADNTVNNTDYAYSKYQLRKAAGKYWLIDMGQEGLPYKPPAVINGAGAFIWQNLASGLSIEETALKLSSMYDIPAGEAKQDIMQFLVQLKDQYGF